MLKVGAKVKCINDKGNSEIKLGEVYTVHSFNDRLVYLEEVRSGGGFYTYRFVPMDDEPVQTYEVKQELPQLSLRLGDGVGVILDPNIPFSRKFAEAFLDAVYGAKND